MTEFTPLPALIGGLIIGLASVFLMAGTGRIAGISGIAFNAAFTAQARNWRLAFIAGMLLVSGIWYWFVPGGFPLQLQAQWPLLMIAGLLVGFGSYMGSGCTSGHGVCGIGRLSMRSVVATLVFMSSAVITVFITRQITGGL